MPFTTISPSQAADVLASGRDAVYVDVRSRAEFKAGHPEGAVNIPIAEHDPRTGQMAVNAEFLPVMEKTFSKEAILLLGCMSGKRSEMACRTLEQAGYTALSNVEGGFGGVRDMTGAMLCPGWASLGLPVATDNGEGISYESIRRKALEG